MLPGILRACPLTPAGSPRTLGLGSATALVIGITIGSGIFRSPAGIAQKVGDPMLFMGLWVAGGPARARRCPVIGRTGGGLPGVGRVLRYLRESWGRPIAFMFGWTQLVGLRASAIGGIALACGQYPHCGSSHRPVRACDDRATRCGVRHPHCCVRQHRRRTHRRSNRERVEQREVRRPRRARGRGAPDGWVSRRCDRALRDACAGHGERLRARAGERALGVRRIRRCLVCRGRGEGPTTDAAARDHRRDARGRGGIRAGEFGYV